MTKKVSHFGWLATGLAISGLVMTPALAKVLSSDDNMVSLKTLGSIGSFTVAGADPDLVAKYNANSAKITTKYFKGWSLPERLDLNSCEYGG